MNQLTLDLLEADTDVIRNKIMNGSVQRSLLSDAPNNSESCAKRSTVLSDVTKHPAT